MALTRTCVIFLSIAFDVRFYFEMSAFTFQIQEIIHYDVCFYLEKVFFFII